METSYIPRIERTAMAGRSPRIRLLAPRFAGDFSYSTALSFLNVRQFVPIKTIHLSDLIRSPVRWVYCPRAWAERHYGEREIAYGGCDRVWSFCHYIQGFLPLLLAVDERRNSVIRL